jgi:hypothetical protein
MPRPRQQLDGHLDLVRMDDLQPGHILRMGNMVPNSAGGVWISSAFSDHIIRRVFRASNSGGPLLVELFRPYVYVHLTGTTSPSHLTGGEPYTVEAERLCGGQSLYRIVLMSTGEPAKMCLDRGPDEEPIFVRCAHSGCHKYGYLTVEEKSCLDDANCKWMCHKHDDQRTFRENSR